MTDTDSLFPPGSSVAFYASDFGERESSLLKAIEDSRGVPGFFASVPDLYDPALLALGEGASEESRKSARMGVSAFRASLAVRIFTSTLPSGRGKTRALIDTETACKLYSMTLQAVLDSPALLREVMELTPASVSVLSESSLLSSAGGLTPPAVEDKALKAATEAAKRMDAYRRASPLTLLPTVVKKDEHTRTVETLASEGTQGRSPDVFSRTFEDRGAIVFDIGDPLPGTGRAGRAILRVILSAWRTHQKDAIRGMTNTLAVSPAWVASQLSGRKLSETGKNRSLCEDIKADIRALASADLGGRSELGSGSRKRTYTFSGKVLFAEIAEARSASGQIQKEMIIIKAVNSLLESPVYGKQAITIQPEERLAVLGHLRTTVTTIALADTVLNVSKSGNLRAPQIDLRKDFFLTGEAPTRQEMRSALKSLLAICENAKESHLIKDYSEKMDGREKVGVVIERLPGGEKVIMHKAEK